MSARSEMILSALNHDWKSAETLVNDAGLEWNNANKCIAYRVLRGQLKYRLIEK